MRSRRQTLFSFILQQILIVKNLPNKDLCLNLCFEFPVWNGISNTGISNIALFVFLILLFGRTKHRSAVWIASRPDAQRMWILCGHVHFGFCFIERYMCALAFGRIAQIRNSISDELSSILNESKLCKRSSKQDAFADRVLNNVMRAPIYRHLNCAFMNKYRLI